MNIEAFNNVMSCFFLHNLEQRHSVFARGCVEKYSMHGNNSLFMACYQKQLGICTLQCENSLSIKEIMTNILIHSD